MPTAACRPSTTPVTPQPRDAAQNFTSAATRSLKTVEADTHQCGERESSYATAAEKGSDHRRILGDWVDASQALSIQAVEGQGATEVRRAPDEVMFRDATLENKRDLL